MQRTIFLSHASIDREVVDAFVTHLFNLKQLKDKYHSLFYSSHEKIEYSLRSDAHPWSSIVERLSETICFVAFLSEAYFKSPWCLAELAMYNGAKNSLPTIFILIDDDAKKAIGDCPWTRNTTPIGCDAKGLGRIVRELRTTTIPLKNALNMSKLKDDVDAAFKERDSLKKGEFFDLARNHFTMPSTSCNPLSFFVEREEYEQTSINMGKAAKETLLWTVFQSPLLVAEAYAHPKCLTPYDNKFSKFDAKNRIRLVIFRDKKEAAAYRKEDFGWHAERLKKAGVSITKRELCERKKNFEHSVRDGKAKLFFTEMNLLTKCIPRGAADPPRKYTDKSFLEFAYGDYGYKKSKILMETGFSSPFSRRHNGNAIDTPAYGHVTFYQALMEEGATNRIKNPPYDLFYGHLTDLWQIAKSVFLPNPNPLVFFEAENIGVLCGDK